VLWFAVQTGLQMAELDPRLIRMVARHFHDLQGGRFIAIGLFFEITAQTWLATRSEAWTMLGGIGAFLLLVVTIGVLDRYYARFGRVVMPRFSDWMKLLAGPAIAFLLPWPISGFPNFVWSALAAGTLWIAWDCRPYRWHQLLTAAAMLYVALGRLAFPEAGDVAWLAPRMWALSSALAIAGTLDHRLFVRAMRQSRALATEAS
jgi:hypothetical protein